MNDHLIAYALNDEHAGTVEIEHLDGTRETVPKFSGGVLYIGDGDFHVRDELDKGDGQITIQAGDAQLAEILNAYPALERVPVVEGAHVVSPYDRISNEALTHQASLRGLKIGEPDNRDDLLRLLRGDDARNLAAVATAEAREDLTAAPDAPPPPVPLEEQQHSAIRDVARELGLPTGGTKPELLQRIAEHRATQDNTPAGDTDNEES